MDKKGLKNKDAWWAPALEIFSAVSIWIAGPIIIALLLGKYLDDRFYTKPWIFLGLTAFSFIISCYGIFRVVKRYMEKISKEGQNEESK